MSPSVRYTLVSSRLAGAPAHFDQLLQLLQAPEDYWKAQTPVAMRPTGRVSYNADRSGFAEFEILPGVTPAQAETMMVLMTARMPQLSVEFRLDGAPGGLAGLRLWHGKLEAGRRAADGGTAWGALPHHSSLIGAK